MKSEMFFVWVFFISIFLIAEPLFAESKYPADVSYLFADIKYSQKEGIKICDIQNGSLADGAELFIHFPIKKWVVGPIPPLLKKSFAAERWESKQSIQALLQDPNFLKLALIPPHDPSSMHSYAGIVYGDNDFSIYRKAYPGILFVNAATFSYGRDQYKMNTLFEHTHALKKYKADWRVYPKKYDALLSARIQKEIPAEFYVLKLKNQMLANEGLVVANSDLNAVLKMILNPSFHAGKNSDKGYSYWEKNKDGVFFVEKYYKSDYIRFSLSSNSKIVDKVGHHYDGTLRLLFILQYDKGKITYHSLAGFWMLPAKALEEKARLNEKKISYGTPGFYKAVEPELLKQVDAQMKTAILHVYRGVLNARRE